MIHLYVKRHTKTNLKYFGRTERKNPLHYKGSGLHWLNHLKTHGREYVVTDQLWSFEDQEECTKFALQFSEENDIVNSDQWANMIMEDGRSPRTGCAHTISTKEALREAWKRRKNRGDTFNHSPQTREKLSKAAARRRGVPLSDTHKKKLSEAWQRDKENRLKQTLEKAVLMRQERAMSPEARRSAQREWSARSREKKKEQMLRDPSFAENERQKRRVAARRFRENNPGKHNEYDKRYRLKKNAQCENIDDN